MIPSSRGIEQRRLSVGLDWLKGGGNRSRQFDTISGLMIAENPLKTSDKGDSKLTGDAYNFQA